MKTLFVTLCLLEVGLLVLSADVPNLDQDLMEELTHGSDADLTELMLEADTEDELVKREECRDTSRWGCFGGKYCYIARIAETVCRETCGLCADPDCTDSYKWGCQAGWCVHDWVADDKCQRTCGTCNQSCQNSYKYGCQEDWCQFEWIANDKCERTCGTCGGDEEKEEKDDNGGCEEGLFPCPDDTCKPSIDDCVFDF